ncbi:hypothetical protein LCGC14_1184300 [marine sediment metagenome]|uniref:Uncharacterized protein n=1 Tax=marine sediment metagenome TaxID=412755 RepID=A0A0F9LR25_9ZZZZ
MKIETREEFLKFFSFLSEAQESKLERGMERVQLEGGQWMVAHAAHRCEGDVCCIHNPTDHHMREWPQHWRDDAGKMERICPHGIGHPDPDDMTFQLSGIGVEKRWIGIHGCDGCCSPSKEDFCECGHCDMTDQELERGCFVPKED